MKLALITTFIGGIFSGVAAGADLQASCSALSNSWDFNMKQMALVRAENFGDNSAPRATLRQLQLNNRLLMQQMNLTMMIQNRCQLPADPADDGSVYLSEALSCAAVMIKGDRDSPDCNLRNWKSAQTRELKK